MAKHKLFNILNSRSRKDYYERIDRESAKMRAIEQDPRRDHGSGMNFSDLTRIYPLIEDENG